MKKIKLSALLLVGLFVAVSCKDDDDGLTMVPEADRNFAMMAADGGMLEVQLGQLAQSKGMTQSVKDFGQMMVTDHTKANAELEGIVSSKDITLPTTLSTAKKQKYDSLAAMQGMAFDSAYVRVMVMSHQETIDLFQEEANNGKDSELKSWASGKLPTLNQHLTKVEAIQDSLNIGL
ncbi:DUF4142 domain-containing protein [Salmonirosea aquatica]|uniref:DUF4142 domain-containing protein n=1 Tax=Salmonirosea aquatica TaxID=2654236 RepID=A0A7C9FFB2_9BACT|nr:DUF4142 domain-containing protein [Cytophagaceae bacterium SJW1-29]